MAIKKVQGVHQCSSSTKHAYRSNETILNFLQSGSTYDTLEMPPDKSKNWCLWHQDLHEIIRFYILRSLKSGSRHASDAKENKRVTRISFPTRTSMDNTHYSYQPWHEVNIHRSSHLHYIAQDDFTWGEFPTINIR